MLAPEQELSMAFAKRLRELRETKGMTATALAAAVGVTRAAISRIEGGDAQPSWDLAVRIARALNVSLDELAKEDEPPKKGKGKK